MYVDTVAFPIILIRIPADPDERTLEAFFASYEAVIARGQRFITISDATAVSSRPSPVVRKRIADWTSKIEPKMVALSVGDARVVQNALIRGAMTAIGWLHQHPIEQKWFTTLDEAVAWSLEKLDHAGVAVPPHARSILTTRTAAR